MQSGSGCKGAVASGTEVCIGAVVVSAEGHVGEIAGSAEVCVVAVPVRVGAAVS